MTVSCYTEMGFQSSRSFFSSAVSKCTHIYDIALLQLILLVADNSCNYDQMVRFESYHWRFLAIPSTSDNLISYVPIKVSLYMKSQNRFPGTCQSLHANLRRLFCCVTKLVGWRWWGFGDRSRPGWPSEIILKHLILFLSKYKSEKNI